MSTMSLYTQKRTNYDSSSSEEGESEIKKQKFSEKLNLPEIFAKKSSKEDVVDYREKYEGRIRSFAHVPGNWASYIHFNFDLNGIADILEKFVFKANDLNINLVLMKNFHLSVSKTFVLQHHLIESFRNDLEKNCQMMNPVECFSSKLDILVNDEKTRSFIVFQVEHDNNFLSLMTKNVDKTLKDYKLPVYYDDPKFHISVGWVLGDLSDNPAREKLLKSLQELIDKEHVVIKEDLKKLYFSTGNKKFEINV